MSTATESLIFFLSVPNLIHITWQILLPTVSEKATLPFNITSYLCLALSFIVIDLITGCSL